MYREEYKRWLGADLEDADLRPELSKRRAWGGDEPHEYLCRAPGHAGACKLGEDAGRQPDSGHQL